jgi:SAM-dependent methyltransferase
MCDVQDWDRAAATFDEQPDHGLRDPVVLRTWTEFLKTCLPAQRAPILDVGCGTGSLSIVLSGLGHDVTGIDSSPAMISQAQAKAAAGGHNIDYQVMDAAQPGLAPAQFDAIVCRHVLWALPDTAHVLARWVGLLRAKGRLVIIEGRWGTGAGLAARQIVESLPPALTHVSVRDLSLQSQFWGGAVADERYAIIGELLRPLLTL